MGIASRKVLQIPENGYAVKALGYSTRKYAVNTHELTSMRENLGTVGNVVTEIPKVSGKKC